MWRAIVSGVLVVVALCPASGQEVFSTIETDGVAVVETPPTQVEFWLHGHFKGETMLQATEQALALEAALRNAIKEQDLSPIEMGFTGVSVPKAAEREARISARLRFSAVAYAIGDDGARQFAVLCDKVAAICVKLQCTLEGPSLGVAEPQSFEDAAIARATEKAYPGAKAAAQIMNGQIIAVEKVAVTSIAWNQAPGISTAQPDLRKLTCTAKIRVTYAFSPAQP